MTISLFDTSHCRTPCPSIPQITTYTKLMSSYAMLLSPNAFRVLSFKSRVLAKVTKVGMNNSPGK